MPNQTAVHIAIDQYTKIQLDNAGIQGVFDNQDDTVLSEGDVSFIKQRVYFTKDSQVQLGDVTLRRVDGIVVIIIHVRKGTGTADRDGIYSAVVKSFRSQVIGGATFLDPKAVAAGNTENWNLAGWNIPFYFYES